MPHILLKFIGQYDWAESFLNGQLYMNSLYYFWNEYPLEAAKRKREEYLAANPTVEPNSCSVPIDYSLSRTQADMLEGTIGINDLVNADFGEYALTDTICRSVGYQYCNVCCFYRLDYKLQPFSSRYNTINYDIPNMNDFGDYVVIIKDEEEFIRRVGKAAKEQRFDYLCGNVQYRKLQKNGTTVDLSSRNHLALRTEDKVPIPDNIRSIRDCFIKTDFYSPQKEWRIALCRGVKETKAYRFDIGSLRDIACIVEKQNLAKRIDELVNRGDIKPGREGYSGNISRKDMKNKFIALGDNQMQMIMIVG